jgi:predicted nucleotidyltransferase
MHTSSSSDPHPDAGDQYPDRLPPVVAERVDDLLARLDRELPDRVEGFYVVGSACLGAFREGRSDIDFVAIVADGLDPDELRRLRAIHLGR